MLQVLLPLLLGSAMTGGMVFGGQKLAQGQQRRKEAKEGAAYEKAKTSPGVTKAPTAGQPTPQAGQEQPDPMQEAMQSLILGKPISLPGMPMNPPVMKRTPDPVVFTKRTIDVPDHLGGGTLTVEPNEGGFFESSYTAHMAHYEGQGLTGLESKRKALVGAEFATAREFGRALKLDQVRQMLQGSNEEQFTRALVDTGEWLMQGIPWTDIPRMLSENETYIPAENLNRIRDFYMNKFLSKAAMETNDPTELDQIRRSIQNYFNIPSEEPVARVKDLTPEMQEAFFAQGATPETPLEGGGGTLAARPTSNASSVDAAKERIRHWDRPRVQQEKIDSWGKTLAFNTTVNSIYDILENPEAGKHLTGPADPVRKVLENLGIWVSTDRVALRSKAAQLWEILYAVRGKQLSDFEIKLAKDMFAALNQPSEVFEARLDEFSRYTHGAIINSIRAETMAGRDVGDFTKYLETDAAIHEQYDSKGLDRDGRGYFYPGAEGEKIRIKHPYLM